MPKAKKPKRKVEFHFIGEHHKADFELPPNEKTIARLRRALKDARSKGKKTAVFLEFDRETVEKLKELKKLDREITSEDVKKKLGKDYWWAADYANLMREFKDVEFVGADTNGSPEEAKIARQIGINTNEFLKKATSDDVLKKLSNMERQYLSQVAKFVGRNEVISTEIAGLYAKGHDKVIYVGGSVHSTLVPRVREILKKYNIGVNAKIEHNYEDRFKEYTDRIRAMYTPQDLLTRLVDLKKLNNLEKEDIVNVLRKDTEKTEEYRKLLHEQGNAIGGVLVRTRPNKGVFLEGKDRFVSYQAAVRGIGLREKVEPPSKGLIRLINKLRKKEKQK